MNSLSISGGKLAIGSAVFAPDERKIEVAGREQRLEPRLAHLLQVFCEQPETILDRDTLLDLVWGDQGSDEALTQAVSRLRQLLGQRDIIQTEPRRGYRLTVRPRIVDSRSEVPTVKQATQSIPLTGTYSGRTVQFAFASGIILGLLIASLVALIVWPETVTVIEEVTQPIDGEPETRTIRCEGSDEECIGAADEPVRP